MIDFNTMAAVPALEEKIEAQRQDAVWACRLPPVRTRVEG